MTASSLVLGGPDALRVYRKGQFGVALQHIDDEESICIWPLRKQPGAGAFIVGLRSLHQYFDAHTARPTRYAFLSCMQALDVMKIGATDRHALHQLLDVLYEYAPDLVVMPPDLRPRELPAGLESAEIIVDGKVEARVEAKN